MIFLSQAFVNQSLSGEMLRVAAAKYGDFANISTRTNKKARILPPGLVLDLNPEGFQRLRLF